MKVSFVFDDGFAESCLKVADSYEARGLGATFAVLVNHEGFMPDFPKGDMKLWNELIARGHVVHPHGWDHSDLTTIAHQDACDSIERCLAYFEKHLTGFVAKQSMYHFTYNRSTPELESFALEKVRAIRATGRAGQVSDGCNELEVIKNGRYQCFWHGPEYCDEAVMEALSHAKNVQADHFMVMLHGLDGEGWGPMKSETLERILDQMMADDSMRYDDLSGKGRV